MRVRFLVFSLVVAIVIPQIAWTQAQAVTSADLRQAIETAAKARKNNLAQVQSFFSSEPAKSALKSAKVDYQKVQKAVSTLSTDELARLASRTHQLQADFAAGALSNQELTYIVIALVAAVVVLVVVAS